MKNDLQERYVYAVCRHLPARQQADVAKELDGLISEMLEGRRAGNAQTHGEGDIRDVLAELGPPEELALKYCGDKRTALISGTYFLTYKHVLRIVLPIVAAVIGGIGVIGLFLGLGDMLNIGSVFQIIANIVGATVMAFTIITIIFAIFDHHKTNLSDGGDMLSSLPEVPEAKGRISRGEAIFGIIFSIAFAVVLLGYPHIVSARADGNWMPVFNIEMLRGLWLPIVLWAIFGICAHIVELIEGRYTMRLAAVTVIANVLIAVCAIAIFGNNIINPEFINLLDGIFYQDSDMWLFGLFARPYLVVLGIILIVLAVETISTIVKAFLARP
ncbi:MAG: hypothetical protein LBE55_05810 [Clostridiales bacterium]|jgi:hypothetical protein|nr:hypothetical protein [Clostridiales bacterium]